MAIVGLGYVGLPLAVAFADKVRAVGFDVNPEKIAVYRQGVDPTHEIGNERLRASALEFTDDPTRLKEAALIIVAVPTPINGDKLPIWSPLLLRAKQLARIYPLARLWCLNPTVYPGVTEDVCVPILSKQSGLVCGRDFKIGYSPERINPGDKVHQLENISKIVAGMDEGTTDTISAFYELIITLPAFTGRRASRWPRRRNWPKNAQRDVNIAFMNELAMAFDRMRYQCRRCVLDAMNTKWNALGFSPGLVGGHCIGVDPYYFIYQAEVLDYHSQIIAAGRKINDSMVTFITDHVIKKMIQSYKNVKTSRIYVMGITFKENCPDVRNSKAVEVCRQLAGYGVKVNVVDPVATKEALKQEFGLE